jgi:beta-galactosidase
MDRREILKLIAAAAGAHVVPSLAAALPETSVAGSSGDVFATYRIGVSYYPEQWPAAQVEEDFAKMQALGINMVRMGEFAWSSLQPSPLEFRFGWLDRAIALAAKNGIAVILGTPTASVPPWLYKLHPDVLSGNEKGLYTYGGRKGFSLDSPAMHDAAAAIITPLSARYGSNPAVVGWQLSNEPGYPMVNYDPNSLHAFRQWLKAHYGTLANLNSAWGGPFWSNEYDAWDEIFFPTNSAEGGWNPGVHLDYRRFFSESFQKWLRFEAGLVRKHAHNQFVYTNWPEVAWSVDIFQASTFLDATAWDNYGAMPGAADPYDVLHTAFNHDLCRASRTDQLFFVAEQATEPLPDTDSRAIRLITWSDVAYGSHGTIFFEFRPPLAGSEMGYVSMLEPDGSYGVSAPVLRQTFAEIARVYPRIAAARTESDMALIYSYKNSWDQGFRIREGNGVGAGYDNVAMRYYTGVKSLKRNVDLIPETRDFSPYRLVIAPGLRILSDATADRLERWVHDGGILVLDRKAGMRTPEGRLRPLIEPGVFAAIAGIQVPALEPARGTAQRVAFAADSAEYAVADYESVVVQAGEPLAFYKNGELAGKPAVTLHQSGRGWVVFVAFTSRQDTFFDALFAALAARFQIQPLCAAPRGVDVVSRRTEHSEFLFLVNNSREPAEIDLPQACTELLTNVRVEKRLLLDTLQVAVLERPLPA